MTEEEIVRMAHEAGLTDPDLGEWMTDYGYSKEQIKRFAELVAAAEREADALLRNTSMLMSCPPKSGTAWGIAAAIRARGPSLPL